jgi:uncharacterized protein (TIGR02466 family)
MPDPAELIVKQFWPTSFYQRAWPEHAAEAPAIIDYLYGIRANATTPIASGVAPAAKSGQGLFESGFDLFAGSHPGLDRLKAFIGQSVQMGAAHANGATVDHRRLRVSVVDSWFHITNDGGFHDAHYHGGCSWCGIYYLQAGDSGRTAAGGAPNGGNRFYSPFPTGGGCKDFGNSYLDLSYVDPPARDGLLILFPSFLLHSALPYRGQKDRIVISFNSQVSLHA